MKGLILAAALTFAVLSPAAGGDAFRCGRDLITVGDTMYEVLKSCGEPDFVRSKTESRVKRDFFQDLFGRQPDSTRQRERERLRSPFLAVEEVEIEEWTYDLGSTRFIRYLTFEDGRLVDITTGDYGGP